MTEDQIAKSRKRLERFLVDLLEPIGRSERRHWGELYVRGLLQDGERKSIEPIASRLPDGNVQAMQQFVGQSPWEWLEVWARLGKRMTAELEPESAWVIDDTGFPKQGEDSVGVDRQYSGTLRSEEHTSELQSLRHLVCRLLLEKKKKEDATVHGHGQRLRATHATGASGEGQCAGQGAVFF